MHRRLKTCRDISEGYPQNTQAYDAAFGISHEFGLLKNWGRGPMNPGIALETGHQGASSSHTRKAPALGLTPGDICRAELMALLLAGFTYLMATRSFPSSSGPLGWHLP